MTDIETEFADYNRHWDEFLVYRPNAEDKRLNWFDFLDRFHPNEIDNEMEPEEHIFAQSQKKMGWTPPDAKPTFGGQIGLSKGDVWPIPNAEPKYNNYDVDINGKKADVYTVLEAFEVTCPALQHLAKKVLKCGRRGHKDELEDLNNIIASANRAKELYHERVRSQQR
tara:strand:+ start:1550 stop:2053 length:504 start_codon:yes stop_codon:yes gene_type:complete